MALPIGGYIGPAYGSKGVQGEPFRQENSGGIVVSQFLPDYSQATLDGLAYNASNQTAQAISVALATTYTGFCLYNPLNSGVVVIPKLVKFALTVAPAAIASLGLIVGYAATGGVTAQTTPLTKNSNLIGNAAGGKAVPLSAATIVTPTWLFPLVDGFTAAALPAPSPLVDLKGAFALLPGAFVAIGALTAVTGLGGMTWDEHPIMTTA